LTIELSPVGVACQLACPYCYEHPQRDAGNYSAGYDLDAMKQGLLREGGSFSLFGGEPLLMKFDDLTDLLQWGYQRFGSTSVQTNGALITPAHVALFARYHTSVGMSLDGPDELNDARWAGTVEKTRAATAASLQAIDWLVDAGMVPSLIVTLHRGNASAERLPRLLSWLRDLDARRITHVRLHALEVDHEAVREQLALSDDENVAAFLACYHLQRELQTMRFDVFTDIAQLLLTGNGGSCVWNACDPLTTPAVRNVNGVGSRSNCARATKDGIEWVKSVGHGIERYRALYETPYADGGCQGCRFFYACKGQCPGTAIDGDWRNRSEQCRVWYRLFETLEDELVKLGRTPLTLVAAERRALEGRVLSGMQQEQQHGDHWDAPDGFNHSDGAYVVHGDAGTTTMHGDHSDAA